MKQLRVKPGDKVRLSDIDPGATPGFKGDKAEGKALAAKLNDELEALQELLYAEHKHKVLVVLQGMDTSGKDGAIRSVFDGVNPQGVRVASFKKPTPIELEHDYLWRIHQQTPGAGEIVIFNRSHYEDVLIVRVHELVPREVWSRRYDQIAAFERTLAEEGATILKFFLHIDRDEQKQRLEQRLADPAKHWKFNPLDLKERARWNDYQAAYEEALTKTSTDAAPWYIVPANKKWYRDLAILETLVAALRDLQMKPPAATFDPSTIKID